MKGRKTKKCEVCGAEAQDIIGRLLCDEHKSMVDVVTWAEENREFLKGLKLTRMKWMEESA